MNEPEEEHHIQESCELAEERLEDVEVRFILNADDPSMQRIRLGSFSANASSSNNPNSLGEPLSSILQPPKPMVCTMSGHLEELLNTGRNSDLTLILGPTRERLPVHTFVLLIRCPSFEELLLNKLPPGATELVLESVSPKVFKALIFYIYTDVLNRKGLTDSELLELLDLAETYKPPGLVFVCSRTLRRFRLKIQNVVQVYYRAIKYGLKNLQNAAFQFMLKNASALMKSDVFLELKISNLIELIKNDDLNCSELEVFQACIRWATSFFMKSRPNQPFGVKALQVIFRPFILLIRFPLLTASDIAMFVAPSKILDSEQLSDLYNYVCSPIGKKPEMKIFSVKPRIFVHVQEIGEQLQSDGTQNNVVEVNPNLVLNGGMFDQSESEMNDNAEDDNMEQAYVPPPTESIASSSRQTCNMSFGEPPAGYEPSINDAGPSTSRRKKAINFDLNGDLVDADDVMRVHRQQDKTEKSWDGYIRRWDKSGETAKKLRDEIGKIHLENITIENFYPNLNMRSLTDVYLDLNIPTEDGFEVFEKVFDIRRFIFFTSDNKKWKLKELWEMNIPITLIINGVTMFKMNPGEEKEIAISFRNGADSILSGLNRTDQLLKLTLLKTDMPTFEGFPTRWLQQVLLYHVVKADQDYKIGEFFRKCSNLAELSCWVYIPKGDNFPTVDLTKDLVSGEKLNRLALSKFVLQFTPRDSKTVKAKCTELYLDQCVWSTNFSSNIHLIFPSLQRVSIRMYQNDLPQQWKNDHQQPINRSVTARFLTNLIKLNTLEYIHIWGLDWVERHQTVGAITLSPSKNLRTSVTPIAEEEVTLAKSFLTGCGLREDAHNFIVQKDADGIWSGRELNELEPEESDSGFWDEMDQLEVKYFQLDKIYKDYKLFQDLFFPFP